MKRFIFITCLVFIGIIGISAKKEQTPIHRLILQGDSCMNEHDSFHAITYYQQYINEYPHDLNVLRKLASCYRLRGDNKNCIACMDSIPNDSLNHEDLRMMFYSYLNLGDKKKVESYGMTIYRKYPYDGEVFATLLQQWNNHGKPEMVSAFALSYVEKRDSTNILINKELAYSLYLQLRYEQAIPRYKKLIADGFENSPIESVEIRSVLTCESKKGVCMKCYGRNLATARMVQLGEAVGVIAAQAIGEPGTQLTLRTFHAGGIASNAAANAKIEAKNKARIEFDELSTVPFVEEDEEGNDINCEKVVSHLAEIRFVDPNTNIILSTLNVPYGSSLYHKEGEIVEKGTVIAKWDPFNAVIVSQYAGTLKFNDVQKDATYRAEVDETTGLEEKIITDSKNKAMVPSCDVIDANGEVLGTYNFPVGGHLAVEDGQTIKTGEVLVKIPRAVGGAGDITGGLPRVTELLEARNPSNPAVVSEIDGEVTMGKVKRGNREIIVTSKTGDQKKYLVSLSKQILVQEHDAVRAGTPLSDGSVTPGDILAIMGPTAVQEYIVNQIQDVYRLQGVAINDKHFEVVVRQMMRKVRIDDPGDTTFLEQELVDKLDFAEENDRIWGKKVVTDAGDSENLKPGQIITARKLRDENSALKRRDKKLVQVRDAVSATSTQILQGITRAALGTKSFMSAASFQETTKVLNEAAIRGKVDYLEGMKENVICGHLIPAGTGLRQWDKLIVGSKEEYERMQANRKNVLDYTDPSIGD